MKTRNFVHKHAMHYQRSKTFADRKKLARNGYRKHKGGAEKLPPSHCGPALMVAPR
ncbi:DUF7230 family protein [Halomonas sp. WWR20]